MKESRSKEILDVRPLSPIEFFSSVYWVSTNSSQSKLSDLRRHET